MGDSNIARIPTFSWGRSEVQAHSFPGATLRHLTAVLLRFPSPRPGIRPVVFGADVMMGVGWYIIVIGRLLLQGRAVLLGKPGICLEPRAP
ncbi:unnamed protein product [Boreogadus saida]